MAANGASYDIKDKVILITGANRGIGRALVDGFLKHGAKKIYAAIRLDTATVFEAEKNVVTPIYIDLSKPESIAQAAVTAKDVQVVVNNAAILSRTTPLDADAVANLQNEMNVNVYGLLHMAQNFAPILKKNGGGAFVQINSVASLRCAAPDVSTYSASKAAAYLITQALRQTLTETRVISVHPGPILTDMIKATGLEHLAEPPSQIADEIVQALQNGAFLVFPDSKSKQLNEAYGTFAKDIIEAGRMY